MKYVKHDYGTMVGKKYGTLEVMRIEKVGYMVFCICKCDCGAIKRVYACNLISGNTVTCGKGHPRWQASSITKEDAKRFAERVRNGERVVDVSKDYGITRQWGYKVIERAEK